jgi:RNA polymerase sigma-70 factor
LRRALEKARACWPGIEVEAEAFFERVTRALDRIHDEPRMGLDTLHVEDLYLVTALEAGDNRAWCIFERELKPQVLHALRGLIRDPREREELAGEVLDGLLLPRDEAEGIPLNTYTGRGGLKGWVQVTAVRRAYRLTREKSRDAWVQPLEEPRGPDRLDPRVTAGRAEILDALRQALQVVLASLPDSDQTLLRLRFRRGFQLKELGRWYGQDKSTLSKRLKALADKIRVAVFARLEATWGIEKSDLADTWESLGRDSPDDLDAWLGGKKQE